MGVASSDGVVDESEVKADEGMRTLGGRGWCGRATEMASFLIDGGRNGESGSAASCDREGILRSPLSSHEKSAALRRRSVLEKSTVSLRRSNRGGLSFILSVDVGVATGRGGSSRSTRRC